MIILLFTISVKIHTIYCLLNDKKARLKTWYTKELFGYRVVHHITISRTISKTGVLNKIKDTQFFLNSLNNYLKFQVKNLIKKTNFQFFITYFIIDFCYDNKLFT